MKRSFIEYLVEQGFYGRNINSADLTVYGQKKIKTSPSDEDADDDDKTKGKKKSAEPKNHPRQKLSTYLSIVNSIQ